MVQFLEFLAVISSGLFGVLLARSKGMDLVGICGVAFIVAGQRPVNQACGAAADERACV